jgi:hypothetical protein
MTESIQIQWERYSSGSEISGTEATTIGAYKNTAASISHPSVPGATSSTMLQTPIYSDGQSGIWLWAIGTNGNIYSVSVLARTPAGHASSMQIINSFSLTAL